MKTYLLTPISSQRDASAALTEALPGQSEPWLLRAQDGDAMAYFQIDENDDTERRGGWCIHADISGRHYDCDQGVISVLRRLREKLGGEIIDDGGDIVCGD